jgi:enoyl-CoA hydratase/carnithine racemase
MIDVSREESGVTIIRWHDGENRFGTASVARWHAVLDELETVDGPLALVITGEGKFFSNGLDLEGFAADPAAAGAVVADVHRLLGRLLLFPAYTVAALNGHTFAAGAMVSCCVDARVMRADRGYWCLPEVDLGLPLTPGMFAAVTARLNVACAAEAMNTGRRFTADEAHSAGIVEHVADEANVLPLAVELAAAVAGKDRSVIAEHKRLLFADAARACGVDA